MKKSNTMKKNNCHSILADYGEDQFSIRINDKGEDIHIKPLDSFSFKPFVPFETNYKRPTKNQAKSLLQQSTILNDTDFLSIEDEPNQSEKTTNQNTNTLKDQTLAIQYPTKSDYCNQQVPFFDPSFFKYKRYFHYFFLQEASNSFQSVYYKLFNQLYINHDTKIIPID